MTINVFGNSSNNISQNKIDTSSFVKKTYLRSNYIESTIEEDIDMRHEYKIINIPNPTDINDCCNKKYVDDLINDSSIIKNTSHINLNDRNITNVRFISVNQLPQIDSHLTAKLYVDNLVDNTSIIRNNTDNNLNNNKLTNINSITINNKPTDDNQAANKKYIEANIEEDIDLKHQYKIINLADPTNIQDACTKNYADNLFNDSSIIKNNAHIDLNDKNITNII